MHLLPEPGLLSLDAAAAAAAACCRPARISGKARSVHIFKDGTYNVFSFTNCFPNGSYTVDLYRGFFVFIVF